MEFYSSSQSARSVIGRYDYSHGNTYGSPLRIRKPWISRISPVLSTDSLTFLSPKPTKIKRIGTEYGSHNLSNLNSRSPQTEDQDLVTFGPYGKLTDAEKKSNMMPEKSYQSGCIIKKDLHLGNRINKRRTVDWDWTADVVSDHSKSASYFTRYPKKRRKLYCLTTSPVHNMQQLEETYRSIDWWQEKMNKLLAKDWDYKRKYWIDQCHNALWDVLIYPSLLEAPGSEMFPNALLPITQLTKVDKHWLNVLVNSARVERIKCPEFAELTLDPQNKTKPSDDEFEFQIQFQFGFDIMEIEWFIHSGAGSLGINRHICRIIAELVGQSKLFCDVQIYYKSSATLWWEQDGIAMMKYCCNGEYIDMVDFSSESESYFIPEWPEHNMVVDDYNELDASEFEEFEEETPHMLMERRFIASVCSQIIHVCICKTPAPQSCAARNVLKQLSMILKGWFIGVLLGGSLSPEKLKFEYDRRAPCLAPITNPLSS